MGYDFFKPLGEMDTKGYDKANYFGQEDDILFGSSREFCGLSRRIRNSLSMVRAREE